MIGDKEVAELRQVYYTLLVRLFWREPEPEFLASLSQGLAERAEAAGHLNESMGEGWRALGAYLDANDPEKVAEEFTQLFVGPHQPEVAPYESFYVAGGLFKEPLVEVRGFMRKVGLRKKDDEFSEPEDVLAFELEIMNWLIEKQLQADNRRREKTWLDRQGTFLKEHLLVWGGACAGEIGAAASADFYKGVASLLTGFLELERQAFHGIGPDKVETLEEARRRHGKRRTWRGPTYDPQVPEDKTGKYEN